MLDSMSSGRQLKAWGTGYALIAAFASLCAVLLLLYDVRVQYVPMFRWAIAPFTAGTLLKYLMVSLLAALAIVSFRVARNYFKAARQAKQGHAV